MGTFRGVDLADAADSAISGPRLELRPSPSSDAADPALRWTVLETSSARVIGSCALSGGSDAALEYLIEPDARGNGYGAEAARLISVWAFARGLPRARIGCDVRNVAAARTALAAGFAFEGIARNAITSSAAAPEQRGALACFARLPSDDGEPLAPTLPPLPDGQLSDGVLMLRVAREDDADGLIETDDELSLRWSFDGRPHVEARLRSAVAQAGLLWLVGRSGMLSMIDEASGAYAGEVSVRLTGPPGVYALGYVVHPSFRGRGFTTRALRLVSAWGFGAGFARLELGAKVGNVASQQAARKAGFEYEGVWAGRLRAPDGTYHDEASFALLNPACTRRS